MTSLAHDLAPFGRSDGASVEWAVSHHLVPYSTAVAAMEARVEAILSGQAAELVWLLEHPPLYTAGVSAKAQDLLEPDRFPVFHSGRGGQFTYHGPGQRVVYLMLDLRSRRRDARAFVRALEAWIIAGLTDLGVPAETRQGRVGVWVDEPHEAKIAAIGVKLRRWVSFHGVSLNVSPDLSHFTGIVPCGLSGFAVTSLEQLGKSSDMGAADRALAETFVSIFGPVNFSDSAPAP